MFCSLSTIYSSDIPQVLSITTGSITIQFHVIFYDIFSTVHLVEREEDTPSHWNDLCLEQTELIPMDTLTSEWLVESDTIKKISRTNAHTNRVRQDIHNTIHSSPQQERSMYML